MDLSGVIGYYAHDKTKPLAVPTVTVQDGRLVASMELGNQSYANDLRENQRLGLMTEMSFGMKPIKWRDIKEQDGTVTREHTLSDVYDISPVTV